MDYLNDLYVKKFSKTLFKSIHILILVEFLIFLQKAI